MSPFLPATMLDISQAFLTPFSPLIPVCHFPFYSCVDAGHQSWTRWTQTLSPEACCLLGVTFGWGCECCENDLSQSGVLLLSNSSGIRRGDEVCLENWGEAGSENNPRGIHHPCKQSIHSQYFLLALRSILAFSFICFHGVQAFIIFSLVIMRDSSKWPSNHFFF